MAGLESILSEFEAEDTQVLGMSCDSIYSHNAWAVYVGGVSFPLLSDFWPHGRVTNEFGILEDDGAGVRATFAISRDGIIRHVDIAPRHEGRTIGDMRAALHALKAHAKAA